MRSPNSPAGDSLAASAPIPPADNSPPAHQSQRLATKEKDVRDSLLAKGQSHLVLRDPRNKATFEALKRDLGTLVFYIEELYLAMENGEHIQMEIHASRVKMAGNDVKFHASQISLLCETALKGKGARRG